MKRASSLVAAAAVVSTLTGCGDGLGGLLDAFQNDDMGPTLFRMQEGVWKVTGPVTNLMDGCMVNPNDPMNPTAGQIFALTNDGMGNIKLGNPDKFDMPDMPQQYDVKESGTPPQPALGASCPTPNNPVQCTTESSAMPFRLNKGTLVRDNDYTAGNCMPHRHLVQQVTLTADGKFTAEYTRRETNRSMCMVDPKTDCTTTWTWSFEFVKEFGK